LATDQICELVWLHDLGSSAGSTHSHVEASTELGVPRIVLLTAEQESGVFSETSGGSAGEKADEERDRVISQLQGHDSLLLGTGHRLVTLWLVDPYALVSASVLEERNDSAFTCAWNALAVRHSDFPRHPRAARIAETLALAAHHRLFDLDGARHALALTQAGADVLPGAVTTGLRLHAAASARLGPIGPGGVTGAVDGRIARRPHTRGTALEPAVASARAWAGARSADARVTVVAVFARGDAILVDVDRHRAVEPSIERAGVRAALAAVAAAAETQLAREAARTVPVGPAELEADPLARPWCERITAVRGALRVRGAWRADGTVHARRLAGHGVGRAASDEDAARDDPSDSIHERSPEARRRALRAANRRPRAIAVITTPAAAPGDER